jgi:hypothetical protein
MKAVWLVVAVGMTACAMPQKVRVVSDVSVVGDHFVVETCEVTVKDGGGERDCRTTSTPIPVYAVPTPPPAQRDLAFTIEHADIAAKLDGARAAVDACAATAKNTESLKIRLEIDGSGQVLGVSIPESADAALAQCVADALTPVKFIVAPQGLVYTFRPEAR